MSTFFAIEASETFQQSTHSDYICCDWRVMGQSRGVHCSQPSVLLRTQIIVKSVGSWSNKLPPFIQSVTSFRAPVKWKKQRQLILNAPITTKVVCFSLLLKCLRRLYGKQCGPRSDCSYRSSLFWVHAVCFYT